MPTCSASLRNRRHGESLGNRFFKDVPLERDSKICEHECKVGRFLITPQGNDTSSLKARSQINAFRHEVVAAGAKRSENDCLAWRVKRGRFLGRNYQTVYLIRHAESTMSGRYCGSTNAALSKIGIQQAKRIGSFFRLHPLEICYLSDLKRAQQTAKFIFRNRSVAFQKYRHLREIHFGDWEACDYKSVSLRWPEVYPAWIKSPVTIDIPSGEPFKIFIERINKFATLLIQSQEKNVAVVAHAGSLSVLTMILLKKPMKQFWKWIPPVGSISTLRRDLSKNAAGFRLVTAKDISHLSWEN